MSMVKNPTKFSLNLGKHRAIQSQLHSVIIKQDELTDHAEIFIHTQSFHNVF